MSQDKVISEVIINLGRVLDEMAKTSKVDNVKGVAVAGCYTKAGGLHSRSMECGTSFDENFNYIGVAYAKIAEMCNTFADSGLPGRKLLHGELGYMGGAIRQVGELYYMAAFSGGTDEADMAISRCGLAII